MNETLHPLALRSAYVPIPAAVYIPPDQRPKPVSGRPINRDPQPKEITDPTRQALRRAGRRQARCTLCLRFVLPDDLCFADGQDAHRSCAETLNDVMIEARDEMREQRERSVEA